MASDHYIGHVSSAELRATQTRLPVQIGRLCLRILSVLLVLASCEKPFEPLAPSDLAFSIYGYLDAAADTQWVRVMPIRQSLETPAGPIDAVVTLEEVETGATVVMSDSISRYLPMFGDVEVYAHNFSTTMPMVPGRRYRLTATRSDGANAWATVLVPTFETPTLQVSNRFSLPASSNSTSMPLPSGLISGTRYLGMVLGREDIPALCNWPFPIHQEFLPILHPAQADGEAHRVQMAWPMIIGSRPSYVPPPPEDCPLGPKRVLAIASGEVWLYGATASMRELAHPSLINRIEGQGLGFLAGVQTHIFPYDECTPLERASPCTITFSPRSAMLVGVTTDSCTGRPLSDIPLRLLSPSTNAIRYETTDIAGIFQFQGLEPEVPNSLALGRGTTNFFAFEVGDVVLAESAVDTVSVEIPGQDCSV